MAAVFAVTVFLSAALLFLVEPLIARMVLPRFGGAAAVWTTCMVFFQAMLLAAYAAAHAMARRLGTRGHVAAQLALLAAPLLVLPIALERLPIQSAPPAANPIPWLLAMLTLAVGLPFFALSTMAPAVQRWFSRTPHPAAGDPYFLYAASNLGSMLALLSYPSLVEPFLPVDGQSRLWAYGYGLLVALTAGCAAVVVRSGGAARRGGARAARAEKPAPAVGGLRKLRWVLLALVPSSLMLGITTHLSTDIAPIPLLWVLPLAVYLLTFILAFARRPLIPGAVAGRLLPGFAVAAAILLLSDDMQPPIWASIAVNLLVLFVAALYCHQELAADRPPAAQLTQFYLWVSLGGVIGGCFNALVAPVVFTGIGEYPVALVLACLLRAPFPNRERDRTASALDLAIPLALGALAVTLVLTLTESRLESRQMRVGLMFGIPLVLCYLTVDRPVRFGLGLAAVLLAGLLYVGSTGPVLHRERSFYGTLRVSEDSAHHFHQLIHGSTLHGRERMGPGGEREPLTYYSREGPVGELFTALTGRLQGAAVGVIGLGAGTLACYAEPGQDWTFYELDPAVARIARDPRFFTFLTHCRARHLAVELGDGRLRLAEAPDKAFRLLILDAFSSDAIPVHLLTREAVRLYRSKLTDDGLLAFHISNRYLELSPVVAALAQDAGLVCRIYDQDEMTPAEKEEGKLPSTWAVIGRPGAFGSLTRGVHWRWRNGSQQPVWRDDFSNLLSVFRWDQ